MIYAVSGENLAHVGASSAVHAADRAHLGLMASTGHRENILGPEFRFFAVRAEEQSVDGFFARWYFVQLFAG